MSSQPFVELVSSGVGETIILGPSALEHCVDLPWLTPESPAAEPVVLGEDDGHLPDVVVLDYLFDQKRRDVRARDP